MEIHLLINSFINALPALAVWIAAIVFASILYHRGAGKPEKLLLVGSIIILIGTLLDIPVDYIISGIKQSEFSNANTAFLYSAIKIFLGLIKLVGIICLFRAFWTKYNENSWRIITYY
jgi:hypothetical protein